MTSTTGNAPAGLQWTFTYPASAVTGITVTPGSAATAAVKLVYCTNSAGSDLCLLTGINVNTISNGVVAVVTLTLSPSAAGNLSIGVTGALATSATGSGITTTSSGGSITVTTSQQPSVRSLTCSPSTFFTPGSSTCTVTLNQTVSSSTVVLLGSNSSYLTVPATVTIGSGSSTATFTANASAATAGVSATVTATLGASSQSASLSLALPISISSLNCNVLSLLLGGSTTCSVTVSRVVGASFSIRILTSNSSALKAPSSVTMPANAATVSFTVTAGSVLGQYYLSASVSSSVVHVVINIVSSLISKQRPKPLSSVPGADRVAGSVAGAVTPAALACTPRTVRAGESVTCEVRMSSAAPERLTLDVTSSSSGLQVPPTIATRPGQSTLSFAAYASVTARQESVSVEVVSAGGRQRDSVVTLPSAEPILTVPATQLVKAGTRVEFAVSRYDPDGGGVSLTASKLPAGAAFDPVRGRFTWLPGASQAGEYDIAFTATNQWHASSTRDVRIEVGDERPVAKILMNSAGKPVPLLCSPGSAASITGRWLQDARVIVNGEDVPVLRASEKHIDFLCPDAAPGTALQISIATRFGQTKPLAAILQEAAPGIFTIDGTGGGQGAIVFVGTSTLAMVRNARYDAQPAQPGDRVAIRVTGAPAQSQTMVKVGGIIVPAESVTPLEGSPGVYEVLITLPGGTPEGDAVPVSALAAETSGRVVESNIVTMAVEPVRP
ncbi:MAG TPA: putative Ig domain-containing protein [Bryobacteraceae bacterium]|nr:putative Ig domain-containing protein [Bryobacteraceae bacterium]